FWTGSLSGVRMSVPHPTICLHKDVFRITITFLKPVASTDQHERERLPTAGAGTAAVSRSTDPGAAYARRNRDSDRTHRRGCGRCDCDRRAREVAPRRRRAPTQADARERRAAAQGDAGGGEPRG